MASSVGNIVSFGVFDNFLHNFVQFIFGILYFSICIVIIIVAAKRYTDKMTYKNETISEVVDRKENKKKSNKKDMENNQDYQQYNKKSDSIIIKILKIFAIIVFMVPLLFSIIGLSIAVIFLIYLTIKSLFFLGPLFVVIGITTLFCFLFDIVYSITIRKRKFSLINLIVGIIFISVGSVVSFNSYINLDYIDEISQNNLEIETKIKTIKVDREMIYHDYNESTTLEIDDTLEDGIVVLELNYYNISSYHIQEYENEYYLKYYNEPHSFNYIINNKNFKELFNLTISNLNNKKIYNNLKLFDPTVKIRVNANTKNQVTIK